MTPEEREQINEVLLTRLADREDPLQQAAADAINEYTREVVAEAEDFNVRKRPWMMMKLAFFAGKGPDPGPAPV